MKNKRKQFSAFTTFFNGISPRIVNDAHVTISIYNPQYPPPQNEFIPIKVLWDTGATGSCVTPETIKALNLKPIGKTDVTYGGSKDISDIYLVNLWLPNKVMVESVIVTSLKPNMNYGFEGIIGMNIITLGDFTIY